MALLATASPYTAGRLSKNAFFAFMWAGVVVDIFFVVLRLCIQLRVFKRLFWDDAFVCLAMICFLASSIARSLEPAGLYLQYDLESGAAPLDQENVNILLRNLRVILASLILSFLTLWSVKISFLLFFRRLGARVRGLKTWWWIVMALTLATVVICFGLVPYDCLTMGMDLGKFAQCLSPEARLFYQNTLRYQVGVDIAIDLLIISIPVLMLWNVRIPLKQKLALMGLCSLTIFIIAFAAARIGVINAENRLTPDMAWVLFWSNMECTISIVVACLGSFRQLFTSQHTDKSISTARSVNGWIKPGSLLERIFVPSHTFEKSDVSNSTLPSHRNSASDDQTQPLKSIYVSYEVEVKHGEEGPLQRPEQARYSYETPFAHRSSRSY